MSVTSDIRDGLFAIARMAVGAAGTSFAGEVTDVDLSTRSCTVISINNDCEVIYPGVLLMPEIDDGLLYVPAKSSTVIVSNNARQQPYISMWSALDQILYIVGSSVFSIKDGITQFNDGSNGGLTITPTLVTELNKNNALLTHLIGVINGAPVPEPGSGANSALQIALKAAILSDTLGDFSEIEDKTVTH